MDDAVGDVVDDDADRTVVDAVVDDADRNYCRNGRRGHPLRYGPWCYVDEGTAAWEYCDGIPSCEDDDAEKKRPRRVQPVPAAPG